MVLAFRHCLERVWNSITNDFIYICIYSPPVRSVPGFHISPPTFFPLLPFPSLPLRENPGRIVSWSRNSRTFRGPVEALTISSVMEQNNEPNNASLYITRKRQGSVGASQILESIVSGSNCQLCPFQLHCRLANPCLRDSRPRWSWSAP